MIFLVLPQNQDQVSTYGRQLSYSFTSDNMCRSMQLLGSLATLISPYSKHYITLHFLIVLIYIESVHLTCSKHSSWNHLQRHSIY